MRCMGLIKKLARSRLRHSGLRLHCCFAPRANQHCAESMKARRTTYVEELFDLGVGFECGQGLHGKILIAAVDHVQLQVVHLASKRQQISDSMRGVGASASKDVPQSRRLCRLKLFSRLAERCPC